MEFKQINNLDKDYIEKCVQTALDEDVGAGDVTAKLISKDKNVSAAVVTREDMVLCGTEFFNTVFKDIKDIKWHYQDGNVIKANNVICELQGKAQTLLTGERTALNFVQTLSGTATTTKKYVDAMGDNDCQLLDTRKTIPGLRMAQKYAVYCGGGKNHRAGLYDVFLIKENHIQSGGGLLTAIEQARMLHPDLLIDVEVENLNEFNLAQGTSADVIMLDNFSLDDMQKAVAANHNHKKLEASGNVTLKNIAQVAATGVDYISVGALTKNIYAVDLSMKFT